MKEKELKVVKLHHLSYLDSVLTMADNISSREDLASTPNELIKLQTLISHARHEVTHMINGNFGDVA